MASEISRIEKSSSSLEKFKTFTYKWTIDDLENLMKKSLIPDEDHYVESNIFSYSSDDSIKFKLRFFPNSFANIRNYTSLYLYLVSSIDKPIKVYFKTWILNEKNLKYYIKSFQYIFKDSTNYFKDGQFICRSGLINLATNGKLTLVVEINISEIKTEIYNLQDNFFDLFGNSNFTKIIKANKLTYKWKIDKFNSILNTKKTGTFVESGIFYCPQNEQTKFVLQFYPNGHDESFLFKNYLGLILTLQTWGERTVQSKLAILDKSNNEVFCKEQVKNLHKYNPINEFKFIHKNELLKRANELLQEDTLTVICELEVYEEEFLYKEIPKETLPIPTHQVTSILDSLKSISNINSSKTYTHLPVAKFAHAWTVDNFKVRCDEHLSENDFIESRQFSPGHDNPIQFNLRMYPRGYGKESQKFVSIFLVLVSCVQTKVTVECRISLINAKGDRCFSQVLKGVIYRESKRGIEQFIQRDILLNKADEFLPDGNLNIICELGIVGDSKVNFKGLLPDETLPSVIGQNLSQLLENGDHSDVVFVVEGQDVRAHKAILSSQSPVFAAMFTHDMRELNENRIEITDFGLEVFGDLLSYIYSGKYQPKDQNIADLFVAADKYDLQDLKNQCENSLCSLVLVNLDEDSVANLLTLADNCKADKLKTRLFDYINLQAPGLMDKEKFTDNISKQLIIELYNDLKTKQNF